MVVAHLSPSTHLPHHPVVQQMPDALIGFGPVCENCASAAPHCHWWLDGAVEADSHCVDWTDDDLEWEWEKMRAPHKGIALVGVAMAAMRSGMMTLRVKAVHWALRHRLH